MADPAQLRDRDAPGYEEDFCLWAEAQATLLRAGRFDALDIENLAEEIDGLARFDRRSAEDDLVALLKHFIEYRAVAEYRNGMCRSTIHEFRRRICCILTDSPSIQRHLADKYSSLYSHAQALAADETGLPLSRLPEDSDFDLDRALDGGFWPEPPESER